MKSLFVSIFIIFSIGSNAQDKYVGLNGGISLSNVNTDGYPDTSVKATVKQKGRLGFSTGLTIEYLSKRNVLLGVDLIYQQRGFKQENDPYNYDKNYLFRYNYNYLALQIKAGYQSSQRLYCIVSLGAIPAMLVNAKSIITEIGSNKDGELKITKWVSKFDFSGLIEAGGGFKLNQKFSFYTTVSFQHSFTSFTNADYFGEFDWKHYGLNYKIGLKYKLEKSQS